MGEEKGKGRANDNQDASSKGDRASAQTSDQTSLLSRIKSSAAGLASSALSAPNSNELHDGQAAVLGDSKSSRSGGSSTSTWAESSAAQNQSVRPDDYPRGHFRSDQVEQHVQQMESDFSSFLDGIDQFEPTSGAASQVDENYIQNQSDDLFAPTQNAFLRSTMQTQQPDLEHGHQVLTFAEQESLDGADVIGILTRPSAMDESMEVDETDMDDFNLQLTPNQISNIRSITSRLFPPTEPHAAPPVDHPLNLLPELEVSYINGEEQEDGRRALAMQWEGVLTGYTDEVWGDLLPLVKKARQEVEAIKEDDDPTIPPKALRRLQQIFKHLQK